MGQKPRCDPSNGGAALGINDVQTPKKRVLRPTSPFAFTDSQGPNSSAKRHQHRAGLPEALGAQAPVTKTPASALPARSLRSRGLACGPCGRWGPWPSGPRSCAVGRGGDTPGPGDPSGAAGRGRLTPGRPGLAPPASGSPRRSYPAGRALAGSGVDDGRAAATGSTLPRSPRAQSAIVRGSGPGLRQRIRHRLRRRGRHGTGLPTPPLPLGPAGFRLRSGPRGPCGGSRSGLTCGRGVSVFHAGEGVDIHSSLSPKAASGPKWPLPRRERGGEVRTGAALARRGAVKAQVRGEVPAPVNAGGTRRRSVPATSERRRRRRGEALRQDGAARQRWVGAGTCGR